MQDENTILQQKLDILKLSHQGMAAVQIIDTLHVSPEMVNEVLNR